MAEPALTSEELVDYHSILLAEKYLCEGSLYEFLVSAWPHMGEKADFLDGPHLKILCAAAQSMIEGEGDRDFVEKIMFNIPPGHTKSITICVALPAWVWGPYAARVKREGLERRDPATTRFVFSAYKRMLAVRDGIKTKNLINSRWYQDRWGDQYKMTRENEGKYENDKGGYRLCVATDGLMGEGGDYIFLDDPHNVEQAESDDVRNKTNELLDLALFTRVRIKNGGIFLIMQRLHIKDYCGHLIADEAEYAEWQHICLPGRYNPKHPHPIKTKVVDIKTGEPYRDWRTEEGELLWPARYDERGMASLIRRLKGYGAAGQIDQNPRKRQGDFFKRRYLDEYQITPQEVPKIKKYCRGWDLAATAPNEENPDPDWTTSVKMGLGFDKKVYVFHAEKFRENADQRNVRMKNRAKGDGTKCVIRLPIDPGQAGKDQNQQFVVNLFKGYPVSSVRPTGPKDVRAQPMQAVLPFGELIIVNDGGAWVDLFIDELCAFPAEDDLVDAAADAFNELTLGNQYASGQQIASG